MLSAELCHSLTRRFTLLRTSSGQPLSIEDLRQRFAEQRARGAEHQISEEEEAMVLEALGRIRGSGNGNANGKARESSGDGYDSLTSREGAPDSDYNGSYERTSLRSSSNTTVASPSASVRSSPSSRSAKRYSNNLFSAGRMRDYNYRNQKAAGSAASQRNALSVAPSESSLKGNSVYSDSLRPVTPDGDGSVLSSSVQTSPGTDVDDKTPVVRSAPLNPSGSYMEPSSPSAAEYRLSKALTPVVLKRTSLIALEEALNEIEEGIEDDLEEEEAEDEIVMPRSSPFVTVPIHHSSQSDSGFSGGSTEVRIHIAVDHNLLFCLSPHRPRPMARSCCQAHSKQELPFPLTNIPRTQKSSARHLYRPEGQRHQPLGCQDTYLVCLGP